MSDRVLVTGATGFIGSHLVEALLERGDQVRCLVRPTSDTSYLPLKKLNLHFGDITDSTSLRGAVDGTDVVYHLAGSIVGRSQVDMDAVNAVGARNVSRACSELASPPVLVHLSSIEAAGPDPQHHLRTEQDPSAPVSNYGRSKLAGEVAAMDFANLVPTTIVRASAVFGERDRETLGVFRAMRVDGLDLFTVPRAHTSMLSLIHARDLADLLIAIAERGERLNPTPGETLGRGLYYAADGEWLTLGQIFAKLAQNISNGRAVIVSLPIAFAWITAGSMEFWSRIRRRSPGIVNLDKIRSFAAGSFTCSPEKALRQLGFSPAASLDERLGQTVAWYRSEGWL